MNKDESRMKKISGLGLLCEDQKFTLKKRDDQGNVLSEEQIDVATYMRTTYKIEIDRPDLPAVNLGSRQRETWFAPGTLVVMPYHIYSRTIPGKLMRGMQAVACNTPETNRGLIEGEGMSKLLINASLLQTIPITISPTMFFVQSTTLKNPKIMYSNDSFIMDAPA
ncbi:hypothetical protein G6011_04186 [Alternaria panax]|uniref:Uncharacterized protein n=1 Tax=Alternaria panax TaxID=48097 RepID=A0AAD4NSA7_9PLEO|nr:hypothetical protein G6011_04186 [Alternaria panax]